MVEEFAIFNGWGNYPKSKSKKHLPQDRSDLNPQSGSILARGCGRSYGDAALNQENCLILMESLNKIIHFDTEFGLLTAEAGCTLKQLINFLVPKGWFLPVTPGTQFVTLGGCLAADVHGKNHHWDGSFSNFVISFIISLSDGTLLTCSRHENSSLFWATIGGMGLTGIIVEMTIELLKIPSTYISVKYTACNSLTETLQTLLNSQFEDKYSVAWIDCLSKGRSIVMNGHHALRKEIPSHITNIYEIPKKKKHSIPFYFPSWFLNKYTIKIFNLCFYAVNEKKNHEIVNFEDYFYPLDAIKDWNRLYGKKGFLQYQCVIPLANSEEVLAKILKKMENKKIISFLSVLKKMGKRSPAPLSFPMEGLTLSLDIPYKNENIFTSLNELDEIVLENKGKIYLAKDARLNSKIFREMYPKFNEWLEIKKEFDPKNYFQSDLARRLEFFN